jgi:DNA-binding MarR family transcriptional regulator
MAQIVVLKRAHFFSLDNDIIDVHAQTIGALGVAIYTVLARYANRTTGECWPAIGRIARTLQLARSTVKVYLRKLEEVGLITITERQDAAGDPSSNRYTLLDPSPAAVDKQLAARASTRLEEGASTVPAPEEGRLPADLPPAACRPTGGASADPKPSCSPEQKEENHTERSRTEESPKTPPGNPCPHPLGETSCFGEIAVCHHCWTMLDLTTLPTSEKTHKAHKENTAISYAA